MRFGLFLYSALLFLIFFVSHSLAAVDKCQACNRITEAFHRGLERTARANFGGGNTQWEESRLGSYMFSETRLVDITERLCADQSKEDGLVCHSLVENLEESIESWWAKQFRSNHTEALAAMRQFLCVKEAGVCCPLNSFGPKCSPCPAAEGGEFCSARGTCDGNGTKSGSGKCSCNLGYTGSFCSECASGYYGNSSERLQCEQCDTACSECTGPSSSSCTECASGYSRNQPGPLLTACLDIDECLTQCKGENEVCTNSPGSFTCECKDGYERIDGSCKKKEEEEEKDSEKNDEEAEVEKESGKESDKADDKKNDFETKDEAGSDSDNSGKDEL